MNGPAPVTILLLIRRLRGRPGKESTESLLGQCEQAALRAALKLRADLGGTVVAMAAGPKRREDPVLSLALQVGCDRAVRVEEPDIDELDYLAVAHLLSRAARHVKYDVIVCGDRSQDEGMGATGPAVAEFLKAPHFTGLVDLGGDSGQAIAWHRGAGKSQALRCDLPCVLCVVAAEGGVAIPDGEESARHHSGLLRAAIPAEHAIQILTSDDLGIDRRVLEYRKPFLGAAAAAPTNCNVLRRIEDLASLLSAHRVGR